MHCPRRGFANPEGMNFCGHCGTTLREGCPHCGFENPSGFAFCGKCGASLTGQPPAPTHSSLALQAHCHHGLGTLYARSAQREQARTALSTAIDLYRTMEMTFWLSQAEAALARLA